MKRTYNSTWTIKKEDLPKADFIIQCYEEDKYTQDITLETQATFHNVTSWDIIEGGKEAEEIEALTDASSVDEHHEYLVLHFKDGNTGTFRNSHVDLSIKVNRWR